MPPGGRGWGRGQGNWGPPGGEVTFSIPSHKCGLVIGRGGENVKAINQQTGAFVEISRQPHPNGDPGYKLFVIRGSPQQIDHAKQLIEEKIEVRLPLSVGEAPKPPLPALTSPPAFHRVLCVRWAQVLEGLVRLAPWAPTPPIRTARALRVAPHSERPGPVSFTVCRIFSVCCVQFGKSLLALSLIFLVVVVAPQEDISTPPRAGETRTNSGSRLHPTTPVSAQANTL